MGELTRMPCARCAGNLFEFDLMEQGLSFICANSNILLAQGAALGSSASEVVEVGASCIAL